VELATLEQNKVISQSYNLLDRNTASIQKNRPSSTIEDDKNINNKGMTSQSSKIQVEGEEEEQQLLESINKISDPRERDIRIAMKRSESYHQHLLYAYNVITWRRPLDFLIWMTLTMIFNGFVESYELILFMCGNIDITEYLHGWILLY
jgi:hypothetical protein